MSAVKDVKEIAYGAAFERLHFDSFTAIIFIKCPDLGKPSVAITYSVSGYHLLGVKSYAVPCSDTIL